MHRIGLDELCQSREVDGYVGLIYTWWVFPVIVLHYYIRRDTLELLGNAVSLSLNGQRTQVLVVCSRYTAWGRGDSPQTFLNDCTL